MADRIVAVLGIYRNEVQAERAAVHLMEAGFDGNDMNRIGADGALGGIVDVLVRLGIPEFEAKRYEGRIKEGCVLLSVHCDTSVSATRAENLLKQMGALDIASNDKARADGARSHNRPAAQM